MLTGQARDGLLTVWQWARHPTSLEKAAREDGYVQGLGGAPASFPRPLTPREAAAWRDGWAAGRADKVAAGLPPIPTWGGDW